MKIVSRNEIITKINHELHYQTIEELTDLVDEEGKNALFIALEEENYEAFLKMITPVKYVHNGITERKLYFDPFERGIYENNKALNFDNSITIPSYSPNNLKGIVNTKTIFYSPYSPFNYITQMKDESIRNNLIEYCHTIDWEEIKDIPIINLPTKHIPKDCRIYSLIDIKKYVEFPLQAGVEDLIKKNILVVRWKVSPKGVNFITIDKTSLSDKNLQVVEELNKKDVICKDGNYIIIMIPSKPDIKVSELSEQFQSITNLFHFQELLYGKESINSIYAQVVKLLKIYGVSAAPYASIFQKIKKCTYVNEYLTPDDSNSYFYIHPELKERDSKNLILKK